MDHKRAYDAIIQNRILNPIIDNSIYVEYHHIVPRSLGGSDDSSNIVGLLAREHYVCHLLLVYMYKYTDRNAFHKMLNAYIMMCFCRSKGQERYINSRAYKKLKEQYSKYKSTSYSGEGNPQYGKVWVTNLETRISYRVDSDLFDAEIQKSSVIKGRVLDFDKYFEKISLEDERKNLKERKRNEKLQKQVIEDRCRFDKKKFQENLKSLKLVERQKALEERRNQVFFWIYNLELEISKKVVIGSSIPEGWFRGRVVDFKKLKISQLNTQKNKKPRTNAHLKNRITVVDNLGNTSRIFKTDPRYLSGELVSFSKGKVTVVDSKGNTFSVSKTDPRYLSGEFVSFSKGKVTVKDSEGNTFRVLTNDPRYLSGELVGANKGSKHYLKRVK